MASTPTSAVSSRVSRSSSTAASILRPRSRLRRSRAIEAPPRLRRALRRAKKPFDSCAMARLSHEAVAVRGARAHAGRRSTLRCGRLGRCSALIRRAAGASGSCASSRAAGARADFAFRRSRFAPRPIACARPVQLAADAHRRRALPGSVRRLGALGLEALSRGAASVVFVEQQRAAAQALRGAAVRVAGRAARSVLCTDAHRYLARHPTAGRLRSGVSRPAV